MRECGAAVLGVVLALVLVANGLTNDVVSNGRRLADGSKMVGAVVIPSVKISTSLTDAQRNCFIDSGHGDTASEALVDSGFLYARLGVSQCCRDHGNLVSSPGALYKFECTYTDGTGTHSSPYFIAQRLQVGTPCLVNCFAFGGCDKCIGPFKKTCEQLCIADGFDSGRCAYPNSPNPERCCECVDVNPAGDTTYTEILGRRRR